MNDHSTRLDRLAVEIDITARRLDWMRGEVAALATQSAPATSAGYVQTPAGGPQPQPPAPRPSAPVRMPGPQAPSG
ncbi:hypothetical protein P0W76_17790, partial [Tsukamurella sp. 8J]|nr:hypothetical protein [Tsukamurella sp. 8J]